MASEKMLTATEAFASIFVPFYFFHAGAALRRADFTIEALLFGLAALAVFVPVRLGLVMLHRKIRFGESARQSLRVGVPLLPTLVFTLVIAGILRERFQMPPYVFGGLMVYALLNTLIPSFVLRAPTPEFEMLDAPQLPGQPEVLQADRP
jgi:Kef-type K+ transport system membrane component KefB